jgi:hypothetical protein
MKQKIKTALFIRVVVLLIGPGVYCLLTNIYVDNENDNNNNDDSLSNDGKYKRHSELSL